MAARYSAGLIPYRAPGEIFLVHMSGPYWRDKDDGAWSIAKGEYDPTTEDPREVAGREFAEEVGMPAPGGPWLELGQIRMPSGKRVRVYAVRTDQQLAFVSSNLFEMEWPPHSGRREWFPETDDAAWFTIDEARRKLVSGQLPILDILGELLAT